MLRMLGLLALLTLSAMGTTDLRQRVTQECPQFADLLRTGGALDLSSAFSGRGYSGYSVWNSSAWLSQRGSRACSTDVGDICASRVCWTSHPAARAGLYSEVACSGSAPVDSEVGKNFECAAQPRRFVFAFVGACFGAGVFAPRPMADHCQLRLK